MFRVIVLDLIGLSFKEDIFKVLKNITKFKGSANQIKEMFSADYENLMLGRLDENEFWNRVKEFTKSRKKIDSLRSELLKNFDPNIGGESFARIKEQFKLAVISEFLPSWWTALSHRSKLDFDYELFSAKFGAKKTDPILFRAVPEFFKTAPNECMFVSGSEEALSAARSTGMQTVLISAREGFKGADYRYLNLAEFIDVVS